MFREAPSMTTTSARDTDYRIGTALVVEDDPILALSLEDILLGGGSPEVIVCSSTRQALAALERKRPDVLVLDVHLVDRDDGWAVAELVTELGPQVPRIVFSTGNPQAIPPAIKEMGKVLVKPYAPEALLEAVRDTRRTGLLQRLRGAISHD
jgi:CheY-like chemotaxis protein